MSQHGCRVRIVEKECRYGGLLGAFSIDGHCVDQGARGIIDSGIFMPMMRQLGLPLELLPNPIRMTIGQHSIDFTGKDSINAYQKLLNQVYPGYHHEIEQIMRSIKRVMKHMDVLYGIENPLFLPKPYASDYLLKTLLPWTVKFLFHIRQAMKLIEPINDHLRKITDNESLVQIITQHFFENTPTFFALSYFSLYLDYSYPRGSTQSIVDSLVDFIEGNGGSLVNGQEVTYIDALSQQLTVKGDQQYTYTYDQLIWAADLNMLYRCLAADPWPASPLKWEVLKKQKFLSDKKGADSVLTLYLIVNQPPEAFQSISGPHAFITSSPQGLAGISQTDLLIDNHQLTDDPDRIFQWLEVFVRQNTLEVSIPALRDPSLSPPGETALIVSLLFDYTLTKHIADLGLYERFKAAITDMIIRSLDRHFGNLSHHVMKTVVTTPLHIAEKTNSTEGSLTGWSFSNQPFPAEFRFMNVSKSVLTPVDTIKQAGQWSFNPAGVPVSILTGKLAADAVVKDLIRKNRKLKANERAD